MDDNDQKVEVLEGLTLDVLIEFLRERTPDKPLVIRAQTAQGAFASIQRRRSAENQRDALAFMIQKEGMPRRARSVGARSS